MTYESYLAGEWDRYNSPADAETIIGTVDKFNEEWPSHVAEVEFHPGGDYTIAVTGPGENGVSLLGSFDNVGTFESWTERLDATIMNELREDVLA